MARKLRDYSRLPGKSRKNSLWLGKDHILSIAHRGYSEEYKRFYFNDIQAIVLRKTRTGSVLMLIFGGLTVLFLVPFMKSFLQTGDVGEMVTYSIFASLFFLFFLFHAVKGPSCECILYTAVNREPLYAWYRIRSARKGIDVVRQKIEAVQGVLTQENLASSVAAVPTIFGRTSASEMENVLAPPKIRQESGIAHLSLFLLLIVSGVLLGLFSFKPSASLYYVNLTLFVATLAAILIALFRQKNSNISHAMRLTVWLGICLMWFFLIIGGMLFAIGSGRSFTEYSSPAFTLGIISLAILCLILGSFGLISFLRFRSEER